MKKLFVIGLFLTTIPACGLDCKLGISSGAQCQEKKKGDLRLNNKTSWTIDGSSGLVADNADLSNLDIMPDASSGRIENVTLGNDGDTCFALNYAPPAGMTTANMNVTYCIPTLPDTLTDVDLNGEKTYGNAITPFSNDIAVTYPEVPPPSSSTGGSGSSGSSGSCSASCEGYKAQCSQCATGTGCMAPCYCAAACVCKYCGDPSCEASNRSTAQSLGTTCSY